MYRPDNYYFTDAITDNALAYLQEDRGEKPFFMYVAYTAAHWPMHAPEDAIAKYQGKYDKGWDYFRQQRLKKMKELGVIDENVAMSLLGAGSWEDESDKLPMARRMETYAAMIEIMDQGLRLLVFFLSAQLFFCHYELTPLPPSLFHTTLYTHLLQFNKKAF